MKRKKKLVLVAKNLFLKFNNKIAIFDIKVILSLNNDLINNLIFLLICFARQHHDIKYYEFHVKFNFKKNRSKPKNKQIIRDFLYLTQKYILRFSINSS
jgi:hypothetical protein